MSGLRETEEVCLGFHLRLPNFHGECTEEELLCGQLSRLQMCEVQT